MQGSYGVWRSMEKSSFIFQTSPFGMHFHNTLFKIDNITCITL